MKLIGRVLISLMCLLLLTGCTFEEFQPDRDSIINGFTENRQLFIDAADAALAYQKDMYISTSAKYPVKDKATDKAIEGVYSADVDEEGVSAYKSISDEAFVKLFDNCSVDAIATSYDEENSVCEFNCGGSGRYYFGIYYTSLNEPILLSNTEIELEETEDGFMYKSSDITYYTKMIEDNFYYFEAIY